LETCSDRIGVNVFLKILKIAIGLIVFFSIIAISAYSTLTFIIKTEDNVFIPNLVNRHTVQALKILNDLGLNAKVKGFEYSKSVPKNHIIFQEPKPGAEIKKGRDVKIIISEGSMSLVMPNIKGLPLQQVSIIMDENDLCQGAVSYVADPKVLKDHVISQSPSAGIMIKRGDCINILASIGTFQSAYKMPDLVGLTLDDAILLIERHEFALGKIKVDYNSERPLNVITHQDPQHGFRVLEGSIVNLRINKKGARKRQTLLSGTFGVKLFRYRLEPGFLKKHIKVKFNCFGASNIIIDKLISPDQEIWVMVPQDEDATIFLYEDDKLIKTQVYSPW